MKLTKLIASISLLCLTTLCFAAGVKNSNINLPGGTIAPNGVFKIDTSKLNPNGMYVISCNINYSKYADNKLFLSVKAYSGQGIGASTFTLNGEYVGSQFSLPQASNNLQITNIRNITDLSIANLDHDDSVTVSSCVATPQTW